jgi:putative ABC transport system permease protein
MYKSYLKIAWRNLIRNKVLFSINISGLAMGICTCLLILLYITDELSYDRYNENADRIVRVVLRGKVNGEVIKEAVTPAPVAVALKNEFADVEQATRLRQFGTPQIAYKNTTFRNTRFAFVDSNFFHVFSFSFLQGDPNTALTEPNTIVITKDEALKYFGDEDPINKILELKDSKEQFRVTGVINPIPSNSHFHFDAFASTEGLPHAKENNWLASNYFTYLVLNPDSEFKIFESKLPAIINKYMGPQVEQLGMTYEKFKENGNEIGLFIQPLTKLDTKL